MAIIAEALAVEVLPPDHPSKARLIGIVKQVQVSCRNSLSSSLWHWNCRGTLECLRLAWMLSQNHRSWRFGQSLPEHLFPQAIIIISDHTCIIKWTERKLCRVTELVIKISSLGGNISNWIDVLTHKATNDMENWFDEYSQGKSCDIPSLRFCENAVM